MKGVRGKEGERGRERGEREKEKGGVSMTSRKYTNIYEICVEPQKKPEYLGEKKQQYYVHKLQVILHSNSNQNSVRIDTKINGIELRGEK